MGTMPGDSLRAMSTSTVHAICTYNVFSIMTRPPCRKRSATTVPSWICSTFVEPSMFARCCSILMFVRYELRSQIQGGKRPVGPIEIVKNVPQ
jgi:hypothetical protein